MRVYLAGCGGMLGRDVFRAVRDRHEVRGTDLISCVELGIECLDFRDEEMYRQDVTAFAPDVLFHLGALTDLEECEEDQDNAFLTNTLAVDYAIQLGRDLGIPVIFISTAGIFDGHKDIYDDWDLPNPVGVYARSKFAAERAVLAAMGGNLVVRAGWMMGGGPKHDKKFVNKITAQIRGGAEELYVVNDRLGTPTYTRDFAENLLFLVEHKKEGLYNMVCGGVTSRAEVTRQILQIGELDTLIKVCEVSSSYFSRDYFAPRPASERLINRRLNLEGCNLMRPWTDSLEAYLLEFPDLLRREKDIE